MEPTIQSGEVLTDVDAIAKLLLERQEKGSAPDTLVEIDAEDGPVVSKQATTSLLVKPPQVEEAEVEALARSAGIEFQPEHKNRVVSYWASDERVDGDGDIIRQVWDFSRYQKNPVMVFCHGWSGLPVASGIKWGVVQRTDSDYQGPALFIAGLFPTEEESAQADSIFRLVKAGFLRGGSVGFRSKRVTQVQDPAERAALGLGTYGVIFEESLLLEFSPCTIGSNPGAHTSLAAAKSSGLFRGNEVPLLRELVRRQAVARKTKPEEWSKTDGNILAVVKSLFPDRGFKRHADMAAPILEEKAETVRVPVASSPSLEENVIAIRSSIDEFVPTMLRRFDDLVEENRELRGRVESLEARNTIEVVADPDAGSEKAPSDPLLNFHVSDSLLEGLERVRAQK